MTLFTIILLFMLSFALFLLEVFVFPGITLSGLGAALCLVGGNVAVFLHYGQGAGLAVLLCSVIVFVVASVWLVKSRALRRVSLEQQITSVSTPEEQLSVRVGDEGVALTRLTLIGKAQIAGRSVEVTSEEGFLDEGTPLVVTRIHQAQVYVRRRA